LPGQQLMVVGNDVPRCWPSSNNRPESKFQLLNFGDGVNLGEDRLQAKLDIPQP
jgi:hypothetical protein